MMKMRGRREKNGEKGKEGREGGKRKADEREEE